jgi:hypothetical protein
MLLIKHIALTNNRAEWKAKHGLKWPQLQQPLQLRLNLPWALKNHQLRMRHHHLLRPKLLHRRHRHLRHPLLFATTYLPTPPCFQT